MGCPCSDLRLSALLAPLHRWRSSHGAKSRDIKPKWCNQTDSLETMKGLGSYGPVGTLTTGFPFHVSFCSFSFKSTFRSSWHHLLSRTGSLIIMNHGYLNPKERLSHHNWTTKKDEKGNFTCIQLDPSHISQHWMIITWSSLDWMIVA